MRKQYYSVDIEATGDKLGRHSMIALGTCLLDDFSVNFYAELKPLPDSGHELDAMRVASRGLRCTEEMRAGKVPIYDPDSMYFSPSEVLLMLQLHGQGPEKAMKDYVAWIKGTSEGSQPVFLASPVGYDWKFTSYYIDRFTDSPNPFGFSPKDPSEWYRGLTKNKQASMWDALGKKKGLTHNALQDAIDQAEIYRKIFEMMERK